MKRVLGVIIGVLVATSPAVAFQCPVLIHQLNEAVATMNPGEAKVKEGKRLIAGATKLHEAGAHADSIATAKKAARILGVSLKLAEMTPAQAEQVRAAEQRIGN